MKQRMEFLVYRVMLPFTKSMILWILDNSRPGFKTSSCQRFFSVGSKVFCPQYSDSF